MQTLPIEQSSQLIVQKFLSGFCETTAVFSISDARARFNERRFDLIITEIMADPDPSNGLPVTEFVEIYNRSQVPINLSGWILFDGSSRILPAVNIGNALVIV
jgi:hypothetical protein